MMSTRLFSGKWEKKIFKRCFRTTQYYQCYFGLRGQKQHLTLTVQMHVSPLPLHFYPPSTHCCTGHKRRFSLPGPLSL